MDNIDGWKVLSFNNGCHLKTPEEKD